MNTSNKILTGFLLLIFLVPVLVLLSFKSKIRNGQFTVVKHDQYGGENYRSGTFQPYKVIKLVSPEGRSLKCYLKYSDSLYYSYNVSYSRDSIRVYNLADTLFIQYIRRSEAKDNANMDVHDELYVEVKLPSIEQLVVNNAEVNIPGSMTGGATKSMTVEVYGTGLLNLGSVNDEDNGTNNNSTDFFTIDQLSLKSTNGEMSFGKNVHIGQLMIHTEGASTVNIKEGAAIDNMEGGLSDRSTVNASWKYVKRLVSLNKNQD